ncbi:hypothetical protein CLV58_1682 [Spirosoma oryzae]|uniref:Uncharacterized protein n=1 Tax=Spirosoma oryzae TaxID=1469603 RepID=A0A2T0REV9_9BACT|nr:hypothetical protein CLV58_1682 [Spirosoma oryzae]
MYCGGGPLEEFDHLCDPTGNPYQGFHMWW